LYEIDLDYTHMHVIISQPPEEKKEQGKKTQVQFKKPKPKYSLQKTIRKGNTTKNTQVLMACMCKVT
jgi:hypothetical protein